MYYATYENRGERSVTEYSGDLVCGGDVREQRGEECDRVQW